MYEISGVDEKTAREAFRLAGHKLPIGFKFLFRDAVDAGNAAVHIAAAAKSAARQRGRSSQGCQVCQGGNCSTESGEEVMEAKDLHEKSLEDLKELEKSLAGEHFQARFKNFTNRLDDTSSIKKARRTVARLKTIIVQKTAAAAAAATKKEG